jgi:copper(I)-binding protein
MAICALLAGCGGATTPTAAEPAAPEVHVLAATLTLGPGRDGVLGFSAHNAGSEAERLVDAACTCARRAEIVGDATIGPEVTGIFGPKGDQVILHGLDRGLAAGDFVDVTLTFDGVGDVATQAEVEAT